MKPKRIIRRKDACARLGCGKTKFSEDYEFHNRSDPFVPDTKIPRLKALHLGPRNVGFIESEIDALIQALAKLRNAPAGGTRTTTTRLFITDGTPPKVERERSELLDRRKRLRAQASADADPEIRARLEEIDSELRALDRGGSKS